MSSALKNNMIFEIMKLSLRIYKINKHAVLLILYKCHALCNESHCRDAPSMP